MNVTRELMCLLSRELRVEAAIHPPASEEADMLLDAADVLDEARDLLNELGRL